MEVNSVPEWGRLAAELIVDAAGRLEVWRSAGFDSGSYGGVYKGSTRHGTAYIRYEAAGIWL